MKGNNGLISSKKEYDEFRTSIGLRRIQEDELNRFLKVKLYTTMADAIRDVMDKGIMVVLEQRGMKPLAIEEVICECEEVEA